MMIGGAIGFYLGIDTPPLAFKEPDARPSRSGSGGKIDTAEFLSAVGTFIATLTAFVSVGVIVLRGQPHVFWTIIVMGGVAGWPDDADHCRSNCTHSYLISALGTIRRSKTTRPEAAMSTPPVARAYANLSAPMASIRSGHARTQRSSRPIPLLSRLADVIDDLSRSPVHQVNVKADSRAMILIWIV
jgi:hypothetical protein